MTVSRQTFEALATAIRRQIDIYGQDRTVVTTCEEIANEAADHFAVSNPRFDRARFMKACGLED